ncbi:fungal specific transcription factor [Colletotrichum scovillei]|uniref:Fungal specific transcription factor n=2 Tax=Colletotrichum scovillei TaxID=1209932 RepID=A0A9P7QQF7_9PEZI|nr:fungal specific transcription factor [Colletotrichum scovillei]KAG7040697.1 fungal specific transcription factor [Colletotrichum scovillei]KAG7060741.1 fungal specific transcription factor [Colletotrichum scovillei]
MTSLAASPTVTTSIISLEGSSSSSSSVPLACGPRFARYYLSETVSPSGAPFFSVDHQTWIRRCTGQAHVFSNLSGLEPASSLSSSSSCAGGDYYSADCNQIELPARHVVEDYLQMFRATPFRLVFPIVDGVLFQETVSQAYDPQHAANPAAQACVFSFLAIITHTQWSPRNMAVIIDSEACVWQAQRLMPLAQASQDITGLQTCLMQCMYHLFCGKIQMASMALALTCRLLFVLGAHRQPSAASDAPEQQSRTESHARQLFWLCYTFDKIVALRTSQPPCIDDEHCDLTLPPGYVEGLYIDHVDTVSSSSSSSSSGALCCLPGDLRLSIIKSKACRLLYSVRLQQYSSNQQHHRPTPNAGLLREVRELDSELERWRLSIPARFRPMLLGRSYSGNNNGACWLDPTLDASQRMHVMVLHFEYQHLVAALHRAASPWLTLGGEATVSTAATLPLGSSQSQTLSVEASRSCLKYFRDAAPSLMGAAFWVLLFYPVSAVVTLFFNLLRNPLDDQSTDDLRLLESIPNFVSVDCARSSIPPYELDLNTVDDFVAEVIRLSKRAMTMAAHVK